MDICGGLEHGGSKKRQINNCGKLLSQSRKLALEKMLEHL
jgi:hypothetical protein